MAKRTEGPSRRWYKTASYRPADSQAPVAIAVLSIALTSVGAVGFAAGWWSALVCSCVVLGLLGVAAMLDVDEKMG